MRPGTRLGPYEVVAPLGAGGMGEVWRARDTRLGRDVAIKVLPADLEADPDRLARFEREARALAALSHPNILSIYDFRRDLGITFAVTELLEGETLRERLQRERPSWPKAVEIVVAIADGLAAAHAKGIVHRDLKPENVFLTADGRVKVLDFGLARLVAVSVAEAHTQASAPADTMAGTVLGTVGYMAPEQARGTPVDQRADVFGIGVVLHEMLGGEHPFRRPTPTDTVAAILRDDPSPLPASVPASLAAVVKRCLAKEPGRRYQGGGELKAALERVQRSSGSDRSDSRHEAPRPKHTAGRRRIRSLVVLPLHDLSPDHEQEYFADGMTEALIADLAKIRALRVISRTSAMRYKATDKSLPEIAAELGVDGVVEGSVLRAGHRVRVTAQLIHAATDTHVWAESYERDFEDVLFLQSEVAKAIVDEMRIALTPEESRRLASPRRVNSEAYDACLKGRFHWYKLSREHLDTALRYFELALEKDPGCARAWGGIAATWTSLTDAGFVPPHEAIPKAKAAALRAIELDDSLADAHVNLANLIFYGDWDWPGAEAEFRRAVDLDHSSADAHFFLADFLISMGRAGEAVVECRRALELDPFSFFIQGFVGWHLVYLGRHEEAVAQLRKALQMEPAFSSTRLGLWGAYYRQGLLDEALTEAKKFFEVLGDDEIVAALERGHASSGYAGAMSLAARTLVERSARGHVPAVRIARLWAHAGEVDHALEWLEKAVTWHESPLVHLLVGWDWDALRSDPRFAGLLRRMNLPVLAAADDRKTVGASP